MPPGGVYLVGYREVETVLLQGTTEALLLLTAIVGKALWRIEIRRPGKSTVRPPDFRRWDCCGMLQSVCLSWIWISRLPPWTCK